MARFIAGLFGWCGLGIIIAEVVNNFNLFDFRLKTPLVVGPIILIFLLSELILLKIEKKTELSTGEPNKYKRTIAIYHLFLGMIGLCFLFSIPFLWWGVIKRLAMMVKQ